MKKLAILLLIFQFSVSCSKDNSVDNVLSAIQILSDIGAFNPKSVSNLNNDEMRYLTNSYCKAYKVGKEYKTKTLGKKFGEEFARQWEMNIPAMREKCEIFKAINDMKPGFKITDEVLMRQVRASNQMERFRLFYVKWRQNL